MKMEGQSSSLQVRTSVYICPAIVAVPYICLIVPALQDGGDVFTREGTPKARFPNCWKGRNGLYTVGFSQRGLLGASSDALSVAIDIHCQWRERERPTKNVFQVNNSVWFSNGNVQGLIRNFACIQHHMLHARCRKGNFPNVRTMFNTSTVVCVTFLFYM